MPNPALVLGNNTEPVGQTQVVRGYVSSVQPAVKTHKEQVYVIVPEHSTTVPIGPCNFVNAQGSTLPAQDAECVVVFDEKEVPTVVWFAGEFEGGGGGLTEAEVLALIAAHAIALSEKGGASGVPSSEHALAITGTPTSGQVLTATSGTAAHWAAAAGGISEAEVKALIAAEALLKAGVSGGQTVHGGTAEADKLTLAANTAAGEKPVVISRDTLTCWNLKAENLTEVNFLRGISGEAIPEVKIGLLEITEALEAPFLLVNGGVAYLQSNVAELTETANNWELSGHQAVFYRIKSNASHEVTGIQYPGVQESGQSLILTNIGTHPFVFKNNNAGSESENRFKFSTEADITLEPNHTLTLIYDTGAVRWRDIALR